MSTNLPVIVGVDTAAPSRAAALLAGYEASLRGKVLRILTAFPPHAAPLLEPTPPLAVAARVREALPGLSVDAWAVSGDPAGVLIDASRRADLLVVGRNGGGVESLVSAVAGHAHCPVIVVTPDEGVPRGPVLAAVDASAMAESVLEYAFDEAARRGVRLQAVHVWSGVPQTAIGTVDEFAYHTGAAGADADRLLAEALAGWADRYPDVAVERMPVPDASVERAIAALSVDASLLVIGARSHDRYSGLLLGSVTRAVLSLAGCPVMVVHAKPAGTAEHRPVPPIEA
jgi:nucleotide-binding universal stress UspA family protein